MNCRWMWFMLWSIIIYWVLGEEEKTISIKMEVFLGRYYMFIQYGEKSRMLLLIVNTESELTTQTNEMITENELKYFNVINKNISFHLFNLNESLYGNEYEDKCTIGVHYNITIPQFHLIILSKNKQFLGQTSNLAFAHKIPNKQHSLVYSLQFQGLINKRIFSIEHIHNQLSELHLGGTPSHIKLNYTSPSLKTKVSDVHSIYWTLPIDYIFIGDISYVYKNVYMQNHYQTYIGSAYDTYVPSNIMEFIVEGVFKESIDNGKCVQHKYTKEVECVCEEILQLNNISFVIGNKAINVNMKMMLQDNENDKRCEFTMKVHNEELIKIGVKMQMFFLIEYDYDKHSIMFMSKDKNGIIDVDIDVLFPYKRIGRWTLLLSSVLIGVFLIRGCYISVKKRKVRRFERFVEDFYKKL